MIAPSLEIALGKLMCSGDDVDGVSIVNDGRQDLGR